MRNWNIRSIALMCCLTLCASTAFAAGKPPAGGPPEKIQLATPTISCLSSTASTITLQVCGGDANGAPAGFSIHMKTYADWLANGWADNVGDSFSCFSLSGNCNGSQWALSGTNCISVIIQTGFKAYYDGLGICGASNECPAGGIGPLQCGTEYVFRVFAHGDNEHILSPKGPEPPLVCRTADCPTGDCTLTWGYWKTHGPDPDCSPGNQENAWNVTSLTIGGQNLSDAQLCDIFHQNPAACGKGTGANAVLILEHQLIAAMLNKANDAINCAFANQAITDANALLVGHVNDCVGVSSVLGQQMVTQAGLLATYNSDQCNCPVAAPAPNLLQLGLPSSGKKASWGEVKSIYR